MSHFVSRQIEQEAKFRLTQFRALCINGPRQSGKTTLSKLLFKDKPYINFESPIVQAKFEQNPTNFMEEIKGGAILDEVQRIPNIFRFLQEILDNNNSRGQFILTGSNNFLLQTQISQSLAGRVGYLTLLPLSYAELKNSNINYPSVEKYILNGGYPEIWNQNIIANLWLHAYVQTYVQRDVRLLKNITDLGAFTRLIYLCAEHVGQLLHKDELAKIIGVDHKTIQSWLALLEESFIIYLLKPWFGNTKKRLIKSPKIYFYDSALLCFLLGIQSISGLQKHQLYGSIFENWVITEIRKNQFNEGIDSRVYFFRDSIGNEVDLIFEKNERPYGVEIKSGKKVDDTAIKGISYFKKLMPLSEGFILYGGSIEKTFTPTLNAVPWNQLDEI